MEASNSVKQTKKTQCHINEVVVIKRNDVDAIHSVTVNDKEHNLGTQRDFRRHSVLNQFLPDLARLSMSWVHLAAGDELQPHQHPTPTMIVVCKGRGKLTGEKNQILNEGDIVVVPPSCSHGFIGESNDGLHCLSVQFGEEGGLYENINKPLVEFAEEQEICSLEKLLAHNKLRLEGIKKSRFFTMLRDGTLNTAKKRQAYLNNLEIWTLRNQHLLFTRQATCFDPRFESTFLQHFNEEVGHDVLYNARKEKDNSQDPVIEAIASWFIHQMFVADNIEKAAIIHLVIENTSDYYHTLAKPKLAEHVSEEYFEAHSVDATHAQMGIDMLEGESPLTFKRLVPVIDKAWDMLTAMVDRVAFLTDQA